jgi:hypothetical protein
MNWRLEKACSLTIRSFDNPKTTVVKVRLIADVLDRFCIGLCLLREDLIDGLDLVDVKGKDLFRFQRSTDAVSVQFRPGKTIVAFDAVQLKALQHFTLRAVRDGMAEVDHIDLELTRQTHEAVDLCIMYPSSAPPVSPEEARRRLGL